MKKCLQLALLVILFLFEVVPHPGAAAAGMSGLEVIGQTAMTQQTFTDLSIIGADSCGLTDAINSSKNPAQTIGEWIKGYWDSWLLRQQLTWGTVLNIAAAGARYTGNGDLLFNSQLSDLFTRFYNWLWDGDDGPNIKDNAVTIPGDTDTGTVNINQSMLEGLYNPTLNYDINFGTSLYYSGNGFTYSIGDGYLFFIRTGKSTCKYVACSQTRNAEYIAKKGQNTVNYQCSVSVNTKSGVVYYDFLSNELDLSLAQGPITTVTNSSGNFLTPIPDVIQLIFQHGVMIGDDQILGDPDKLGGLTGADTNVVAPPDIINWPDFGGNGGYIDINDYITGVRGAIESEDGTADVNITDSEGVDSTQTMEIDQATDIPVETETTAEMENQGEVISTATPSTELADYTIDLRNYFPFCIPWDLYDMVTLLVADPVAPHVQYPFVIEPLNVNYTIDLDFSQFDSVAAVLRTMELLAAGIGLALMTKRLIQGGD